LAAYEDGSILSEWRQVGGRGPLPLNRYAAFAAIRAGLLASQVQPFVQVGKPRWRTGKAQAARIVVIQIEGG